MDLTTILAGIQDEGTKTELQALAARAAKATELEASLQGKTLVDNASVAGWQEFDRKWQGGLKDTVANAQKLAADKARLEAEVARLKPEAERAAILAAQGEGNPVDPEKIALLIEQRFADRLLTPEREKRLREEAAAEAKRNVDFGSIPATTKLIEKVFQAKDEFGLKIPVEQFADAANRYGGFDQAYDALTREAREQRSAAKVVADKAAYDAAILEAERRGAQRERLAFENNTSFEEAGGSGASVLPMNPQNADDGPMIDAKTYDPSQGVLAREAAKRLQALENKGTFNNVM